MSLPAIRVVDIQHNNEPVDLSELTENNLGSLIFECKELINELEDAYREVVDNESD